MNTKRQNSSFLAVLDLTPGWFQNDEATLRTITMIVLLQHLDAKLLKPLTVWTIDGGLLLQFKPFTCVGIFHANEDPSRFRHFVFPHMKTPNGTDSLNMVPSPQCPASRSCSRPGDLLGLFLQLACPCALPTVITVWLLSRLS